MKVLKKIAEYFNILNFVLCDLYASLWQRFYRIGLFFGWKCSTDLQQRLKDMKSFNGEGTPHSISWLLIILLFGPWIVFFSIFTERIFSHEDNSSFFWIFAVIFLLPAFLSIAIFPPQNYFSLAYLKHFREVKRKKYRCYTLLFVLSDVLLMIILRVFLSK